MSFEILIAHDGHQERRALSVPGSITIGRDADCTISLNSALVSRRHVSLAITGSVMRVQDSSRNGTLAGTFFLNNSAREVPLDTPLTVGEYTLSVLSRTQPAPPAEPVPEAPRLGAAAPELAGQENAREHALELAAEEQQRAAISLRRDIHRLLLEHLDLATVQASKLDDPSLATESFDAVHKLRDFEAATAAEGIHTSDGDDPWREATQIPGSAYGRRDGDAVIDRHDVSGPKPTLTALDQTIAQSLVTPEPEDGQWRALELGAGPVEPSPVPGRRPVGQH